MTKDVYITVTGRHRTDGEWQEPVETKTRGRYYFKNGKHYLLYEETQEGVQGVIKNTVKFDDEVLQVSKKGAMESEMSFREGERKNNPYRTPQGVLYLEIETEKVTVKSEQTRIEVEARYAMFMGDSKVQDSTVTIRCVPYPML